MRIHVQNTKIGRKSDTARPDMGSGARSNHSLGTNQNMLEKAIPNELTERVAHDYFYVNPVSYGELAQSVLLLRGFHMRVPYYSHLYGARKPVADTSLIPMDFVYDHSNPDANEK
jgi:hypothetical protein